MPRSNGLILEDLFDGSEELLEEEAIRVCVSERIVEDVGVSVEVLRRVGFLDVRINGEEASDDCVIDTAIHVDEADLFEMLMLGEAAIEVR